MLSLNITVFLFIFWLLTKEFSRHCPVKYWLFIYQLSTWFEICGKYILTKILTCIVIFFSAPKPSNVVTVLGTKCYDNGKKLNRSKWFVPRGIHKCEELQNLDPTDEMIVNKSITEKQVVFSFWLPGPRGGEERKMTPLFQNVLAVLQVDIEHSDKVPLCKCKIKVLWDIIWYFWIFRFLTQDYIHKVVLLLQYIKKNSK